MYHHYNTYLRVTHLFSFLLFFWPGTDTTYTLCPEPAGHVTQISNHITRSVYLPAISRRFHSLGTYRGSHNPPACVDLFPFFVFVFGSYCRLSKRRRFCVRISSERTGGEERGSIWLFSNAKLFIYYLPIYPQGQGRRTGSLVFGEKGEEMKEGGREDVPYPTTRKAV